MVPLLPLLAAVNDWLKENPGDPSFDPDLVFEEKPGAWTREGQAQLREILRTPTPLVRSGIEVFIAEVNESNPSSRHAPMTGTNTST
jgi:hypothetical protein